MSADESQISPSLAPGDKPDRPESLPDDARRHIIDLLAEDIGAMIVIYTMPAMRAVFFNTAARKRLTPGSGFSSGSMTLRENIGLSSQQRFDAEMLPQIRVLGRWTGECSLRDTWGGELAVDAFFKVYNQRGSEYVALHARERVASVETDGSRFTDRELLHALLDYAPDHIYFKDASSQFLRISRSQARIFGLKDPAEAIGKTDFDFFTAEHASAAYADEQRILRTGEPVIDHEEMETWENGRISWVATTKLPLYDASGKLIGTFGVSHDITSRKQAEAARREMETQLQLAQKMESIGRLAAGVAHEINTPTQFITDNTHFLADSFTRFSAVLGSYRSLRDILTTGGDCGAALAAASAAEAEAEIDYLLGEIPRCLQQSQDGLARVARIVCSLKEFAHPNSPELTPADLNRTIETALVVSRHEWKYVAEVTTELDPSLPPIPCVVDEFSQVVLNLVINAAHAIEDALKERSGGRGKIVVRTRLEPNWAVLEIEDDGTGMKPEVRDRIFEPFFTTKPSGKGTGQGLAIVHTVIAKHHRGTIDVFTELGLGTKFVIKLPLHAPIPAST